MTLHRGRIFGLVLFKRRVPDQVRTLNMQGVPTIPRQMGLKVGKIRQRLSMATVRANQGVLLARLGQVGEGSAMAWRRRSWQRVEEKELAEGGGEENDDAEGGGLASSDNWSGAGQKGDVLGPLM